MSHSDSSSKHTTGDIASVDQNKSSTVASPTTPNVGVTDQNIAGAEAPFTQVVNSSEPTPNLQHDSFSNTSSSSSPFHSAPFFRESATSPYLDDAPTLLPLHTINPLISYLPSENELRTARVGSYNNRMLRGYLRSVRTTYATQATAYY
ncbi:hypothetical protein BGX26_007194, partial [Mortierella sp. AD094]